MYKISRFRIAACFFVLLFLLSGCGGRREHEDRDIDFTVCSDSKLPEELLKIINEKKEKPFKLAYVNSSYMYIVIGYGEMPRANYNVAVERIYSTGKEIIVKTNLYTEQATLSDGVPHGESSMYPYIVIKCEKYDVPVTYE